MAKVFVAMSGGVDSSVAASLLIEQGHDVTGVTMELLDPEDSPEGCCSLAGSREAKRACHVLGVPHYTMRFREVFRDAVVGPFVEAYARGRTPNPCIACNDLVKFEELLPRVLAAGADALATGHYARVLTGENGRKRLARGLDRRKDQSYFLYRTSPEQLELVLFPLAELTKDEVRSRARALGLPNAERPESQDVCFLAGEAYAETVCASVPEACAPGPIVDTDGRVVGRHQGIARYTIGQRKGLGSSAVGPRYVLALDAQRSTVVVGGREDLAVRLVEAQNVCWSGPEGTVEAAVQVRYRGIAHDAAVTQEGDSLVISLRSAAYGVAPGQAAVCYNGDVVLGGGEVSRTA